MGLRDTVARLIGIEDRAQARGYTDQSLINQYRLAVGKIDALQTACENAARITALTMTRGDIELNGPLADYWRSALTDDLLFQAVYDATLTGNAAHYLDTADTARGYLQRVGSFEVRGERRPYRYQIEIPHPDGFDERSVQESDIMHLRIGADHSRPWLGRSMFADVLLRHIDRGLIDLARLPTQRIVNYPRSSGYGIDEVAISEADRQHNVWGENLSKPGLLNMVDNSTNRGNAQSIPYADLNFKPDQYAVELRRDLRKECYEAVGYPPVLLSMDAPGQTVRQEFTRWIVGTLQPMAGILAGHIGAALSCACKWNMDPARIPLPLDQSTVFRNLARSGVDKDEALKIAGLS